MVPLHLGGSVTPVPNSVTEVIVLVPGAQSLKVLHLVCRGVRVDSATLASTDILFPSLRNLSY